eukprot:5445295-Prymnesium_polylepis.1
MMRLLLVVAAWLCASDALVVTPMRASVASAARSLEVQMFMGGMGAAPKRAGAPKKAKVASSAFAKNAKRPKVSTHSVLDVCGSQREAHCEAHSHRDPASPRHRTQASLNILERGPAGIAEPLKEGKKFFRRLIFFVIFRPSKAIAETERERCGRGGGPFGTPLGCRVGGAAGLSQAHSPSVWQANVDCSERRTLVRASPSGGHTMGHARELVWLRPATPTRPAHSHAVARVQ